MWLVGSATTVGNIEGLLCSWARHLQAAHLSANTITNYRYAADRLHEYLVERACRLTWVASAASSANNAAAPEGVEAGLEFRRCGWR
jgi:hypothetical protein